MIGTISINGDSGKLTRPVRFLPHIPWSYQHRSFAYGPPEVESAIGLPDLTRGNYNTQWVAYVDEDNAARLVKKEVNALWSDNHIDLITLTAQTAKVSLEFSPEGRPLLGYLLSDDSMGVWWVSPLTKLPELLALEGSVQDLLMSVENKDDPENTDVFLWYFSGGSLFLRKYSENFSIKHGPYVTGVSSPVILQAGMNHRYGYQVDYRDQP